MTRLCTGFLLGLIALFASILPAVAQDAIPDRRLVVTRDIDFYGSDLQPLFDSTLSACERTCLNDPQCRAFTYNINSNACFPKSDITDRVPFVGALSARVIEVSANARLRASDRRAELAFLSEPDLAQARNEATALPARHAGGQYTVDALLEAAEKARSTRDLANAIHWTGAAVAQSDEPAHWLQLSELQAAYAETRRNADRRTFRNRAYLSAINAYLRAEAVPVRQTILAQMATMLERRGQGRASIAPLKLADNLGTRADITAALDEAIAQYGFRITENTVEADSAAPRICAQFSEDLIRAGTDYAPYVRLPDPRLAVSADDRRICISGVAHGARYTITFRAGLPSAQGDALVKDVPITAYVRDRSPSVAFPGRAYVLPRAADAGLPIETVNTAEVDLVLRRVSDRNLVRTIQEDYFARPLGRYAEDYFATEIAEEVWRGTGSVENSLNATMLTRLPMGEAIAGQPAGVYALTASASGVDDPDRRATQWFILSDIGLTTMQGSDGLTVVTRSLSSADPMQGLTVALVSASNRVLAEVETDAEGLARFAPGLLLGSGSAQPALVTARDGADDLAFLSLREPAFDLSDRGVEGRDPSGPIDAFLTTDRGAYRPGEVIHATSLMRDAQAMALPDLPAIAVLTRPDGVEYSRHISDATKAGGHVFTLPLGPTVPRGTWRLAVFADPDAPALASNTVLVEDFVPERIDFDLSLPEGPISLLSPPQLQLEARYLFGAVGANLPVRGDLRLATRTTLDAFPGFRFGRHTDEANIRVKSFASPLTTSADGTATLPLPIPEIDAQGRPMQATVTIEIAEGSGRPVERSITRPVAPQSPVIGIKPAFDDTLPEGSEARFDVIALDPSLNRTAMDVSWQVNRVRTRYQWYQIYGNWNWEPITTRETIARGTGTLGTDPLQIAADVDWGAYEVVIERTDGAYVSASMAFDAGWYAPADAAQSPDMLELSLDKPAYRPGETATLRMVPRDAGRALVTVMADRVISMQTVDVPAGATTLDLPVTDEWGAGVYVTAQVIRPADDAIGQSPARALGLAHAAVDPGDKRLSVSFDAPTEASPRATMDAAVVIDGLEPGTEAYVTVAAVDLGILNLTGFESPDPAAHYFGQRRLGVEIRDIYGRLIDGSNGAMGAIRSGGDASAGMRMQSPPPTEALAAFFSGPVTVDAQGRAPVSFDLPDFNGTLRLMAVAWSPTGVGQAETDVLVRDPVVISASMPRFLSPGDSTRLLIELTHTKGAAGDMPFSLGATGLQLDAATIPASVTLAENGKTALRIPLTAGPIGDHRLTIALTTPDGQRLTKDLTLGVRALDPATATTRRFALAPGATFQLDDNVFAGFRADQASAMVSAGPLARFDAPGLLAALDRYPYGCTEQVTSQAMPLLYLSSVAEPLGIGNQTQIATRIEQSIAQILTRQSTTGAFGLWRTGSGDFWLDAYVTDFLSRARLGGHSVPELAFTQALDNLANRVAYAPDFDAGGEDIAYALMVLAREGRAAMGDLRYYADEKADALGSPMAQAQLGAALAYYGDQQRADRMFAKSATRIARGGATPEDRVFRADYGSRFRDRAALLSLVVEARSDAVDRITLASQIGTIGRALSTQEQAWALLAAHALVQDPTVSGLTLDGTPVSGPFVRRFDAADLGTRALQNTGTRDTDVTLTTIGVPDGPTEAGGYGYALTRAYYDMEGNAVSPETVAQGTRLVTVLTVKPAEATRARLMVNDALPAGFEIDNPSLLRAGDLAGLDWLETAETEHAEFRTERFLAAVTHSGTEPFRLAYIARAVSPGTFHHPAALVEDMYRPDYRATTASGTVTVTSAP
ncbi:alpha-2-macroglobulin family protein [Cognatishimia sp. F0-27]|uniref:alpha-2-macroglobulin family protein n=1 Tax=Cognatishimia sp. F0-27 TaxID=2816855 RepID=UPI001D0C8020|nr:alpha-2-macroglobulin family protein [Cognatishimia sp. F0-27]MCC1491238.1 alpha-2-macroglobulin family protein [Cognatishimia sp. F0-27]